MCRGCYEGVGTSVFEGCCGGVSVGRAVEMLWMIWRCVGMAGGVAKVCRVK